MDSIGEDLPLYVACGLLKEIEIDDGNDDDLCTVLPLDEEDGCVGVLKVFSSREAALGYANDAVEFPSEKVGEKKLEIRGDK